MSTPLRDKIDWLARTHINLGFAAERQPRKVKPCQYSNIAVQNANANSSSWSWDREPKTGSPARNAALMKWRRYIPPSMAAAEPATAPSILCCPDAPPARLPVAPAARSDNRKRCRPFEGSRSYYHVNAATAACHRGTPLC